MLGFTGRDIIKAVEAGTADAAATPGAAAKPGSGVRRQLSELASKIADEAVGTAYSPVVLAGIIRLIEFTVVMFLGAVIYLGWVYPTHGIQWASSVGLLGLTMLTLLAFQAAGLYDVHVFRTHVAQFGRLLVAWTLVFLVATAIAFFTKAGVELSRVWLGAWYLVGLGVLTVFRIGLAQIVRSWSRAGRLQRRAVIVGGGEAAEELIQSIQAQTDSDVTVCGTFDDRTDARSPAHAANVPKLGTVDDLVEFARRTRVDLVIVTIPMTAEARVLHMLRKLWILPVDIRLAAHTAKLRFRPRAYSYIGNVPVLDVFDKPIQDWDVVLKWIFDKIVGTCALIALSPIFLATAIAVKLDSKGPVFFRQKRYGFNNELIEVFKFRSMYTDQSDATAARLVTKGDPRVTRVGRFIRKTSIDELPQLFNVVFKGDLSLVGPRPHAVHAKAADQLYDDVVDGYFARHKVKPGITGWAQVNGWRGETDTQDKIQRRVEHDLYYIENWSVLFDLYILAKTPLSLASHRENAF
ncbi:undecaprenyl-phosphate glucose phosphotransferase [Phreatobacter stygius]|uniref:Undecaprenyl-phosphate glucose phosphotransferase n=1 Tax=Phreatobacter stygius TaxID=1940610 RepID=A0A4D7B4Y9_9HYPH|nr:undecaprenyl-phosphate glucose phosphotransferase [Phreatobacter stygius]QCI68879.1 undecaprenyl-phosphate glucose phosphotransferase [Phreatobacter stygius]